MNQIETKVLNPEALEDTEKLLVVAARLTQRGPVIQTMEDFDALYNRKYSQRIVEDLLDYDHPTLQKLSVINVAVTGCSRRFLAQITRHQDGVKFVSTSIQYSDYSKSGAFVVPYELLERGGDALHAYKVGAAKAFNAYRNLIQGGVDADTAGYLLPEALRGAAIISASPYQWKHMISQRVCKRNTAETRYIMLRIWEQLQKLAPTLFSYGVGPACMTAPCAEKKLSCGHKVSEVYSADRGLHEEFPLLYIVQKEREYHGNH